MDFSFVVNASVERSEGKFESRDTIEAALVEALEGADPGDIEGDNGGRYDVTDWSVEDNNQAVKGAPKVKAPPTAPPLAPNLVRLISAYVRVDAMVGDLNEEIDNLLAELKILSERFPKITEQERTKIYAKVSS